MEEKKRDMGRENMVGTWGVKCKNGKEERVRWVGLGVVLLLKLAFADRDPCKKQSDNTSLSQSFQMILAIKTSHVLVKPA